MTRTIWIASTLALVVSLGAVPTSAFAVSPLLSGYGGPGAGEQAIVGSTLLGGPRGGSGPGGLSGSDGSPLAASGGRSSNGSAALGSHRADRSRTSESQTYSGSTGSAAAGDSGSRTARSGAPPVDRAGVGRYESSQGSAGDSLVVGMSSGDVLALAGILVALTLIGTLTVRLAKLQP